MVSASCSDPSPSPRAGSRLAADGLADASGERLRLAFSEHAKGRRQQELIAPGQTPSITHLPFTQFYWALNGGMAAARRHLPRRGENRLADSGPGHRR